MKNNKKLLPDSSGVYERRSTALLAKKNIHICGKYRKQCGSSGWK